jgi:nitrate reductase assembly molybdenum cofactor insertion protein NarJ
VYITIRFDKRERGRTLVKLLTVYLLEGLMMRKGVEEIGLIPLARNLFSTVYSTSRFDDGERERTSLKLLTVYKRLTMRKVV